MPFNSLTSTSRSMRTDILIRALEPALRMWEEATRGMGLLRLGRPDESILAPLTAAISQCRVYKAVAGHVLFTAYSGPVLHAPSHLQKQPPAVSVEARAARLPNPKHCQFPEYPLHPNIPHDLLSRRGRCLIMANDAERWNRKNS